MSWLPLFAAETDYWAHNFMGLDEEKRFVVLLVALGCGTGIIATLSATIGSVVNAMHRRSTEYELKREMLDRGMSAEEVAQVIEATPGSGNG